MYLFLGKFKVQIRINNELIIQGLSPLCYELSLWELASVMAGFSTIIQFRLELYGWFIKKIRGFIYSKTNNRKLAGAFSHPD